MNWYAIHTKPRQESVAQTSLQREGIETFCPKLKRKRTIRRVRKWMISPLFPCYFFARFDIAKQTRLVKYATGVANIVSFGGQPSIVEDAIFESIRTHCTHASLNSQPFTLDTITIQPSNFRPGDIVEIQTGPLRGLQGIFEREMSDRDRVVILLEALAKAARVEVSREMLEKVTM